MHIEMQQMELFVAPDLQQQIRCLVSATLQGYEQPSARELLTHLEEELGWTVRIELLTVIEGMACDKSLTYANRKYLKSLVNSGDLVQALRGEGTPERDATSSIDTLVQQSRVYRDSSAFAEMIEFVSKFRDYSPYNNMLVRVQNPSCGYYATARDWGGRFKRGLRDDAKPMLFLAPMHPVLLVYDLDQTEGDPLPEHLLKFAQFEGKYEPSWLEQMIENAKGHRIKVEFKPLSSVNAGFATLARDTGTWKMRIAIHDELDGPSRLGVLCHELAHILLGHLGSDNDLWWPCRSSLTRGTVEIEAESVAYITTVRLGLQGSSAAYLCRYLDGKGLPPSVSFDFIAKVSGHIERMALERMPPRRAKAGHRPSRNPKSALRTL